MRTFVFGAGASVHSGYPLASKLWSALERWGSEVIAPEEYRDVFAREILVPDDLVITLNYDVSLDRELQRSGNWTALDGYGFSLDGSDEIRSHCAAHVARQHELDRPVV